ncbi:hypothetical protein COCNU_05G005260 [Cocos nucifera]|uniref:Uncharacterized protein n=1 Tax=Cocos nucifera TaxID=13894 RepID=A0A8K0N1A4_COCNU|nr:hypothetical protein COCNU_05G005260 [Cocos nucifera]
MDSGVLPPFSPSDLLFPKKKPPVTKMERKQPLQSSLASECHIEQVAHSSVHWKDLSGFDVVFFYEEFEHIPESLKVFNTIFSYINGLTLLSANSQDSNLMTKGNKESPISMHVRSRRSTTPASKRSVRLRAKKVKMLGLDEVSLCSEDIFTINSLTANDIRNLGLKCDFIFPTADDEAIHELKQLELARYKFAPNKAAC